MKTAQDYLDAANAIVPRIPASEAIAIHSEGRGTFIDVRDSAAIAQTGTIAGAHRIPRGFLEFAADKDLGSHDPALDPEAEIFLVCGKGGQAALSGATLKAMGFAHVTNIGGIGDWKDAGGPMDAG
ncbi:rhodanese-like domain-containing protein [Jannaschia sp. LMIT008]|uniref:rhodanese-like domain-containing protein n=1 Tax=Jannaschia maritima TaxID=3032585 RepID=UPI002812617D|nr:rhodanese-like domain-containing protein [Jannaschia sp. LMIT008]